MESNSRRQIYAFNSREPILYKPWLLLGFLAMSLNSKFFSFVLSLVLLMANK